MSARRAAASSSSAIFRPMRARPADEARERTARANRAEMNRRRRLQRSNPDFHHIAKLLDETTGPNSQLDILAFVFSEPKTPIGNARLGQATGRRAHARSAAPSGFQSGDCRRPINAPAATETRPERPRASVEMDAISVDSSSSSTTMRPLAAVEKCSHLRIKYTFLSE